MSPDCRKALLSQVQSGMRLIRDEVSAKRHFSL